MMDGEAILINLSSGMYYSMDGAGGLMWQLVEGHASIEEIARTVSARYLVDLDRATADLLRLAAELVAAQLVLTSSAPAPEAPEAPAPPPSERSPYETPRLNAYHDMADLLALDPPHPGLASALSGPPSEKS